MTTNKTQGQTLKCVGLDLRQPVFTHGMLYVALSRIGDRENIHYLAQNELTQNVSTLKSFKAAVELLCCF